MTQAEKCLVKIKVEFIINELKKSKSSGTTWRVIANQVIMGRLTYRRPRTLH